MSAVLMPDLARALGGHHARADRRVGHAFLAEELAVRRRGDARHDVAADAVGRERGRRVVPERGEVDREAPARVEVRPLVAQPQVAVRDVRDAAPAAADRPKDAPELLLRAEVAFLRHAAREHVDDGGLPVAHELDQARETGEDVERLEAGDDDGDPVLLDERLEDSPPGDRGGVPRARGTLRRSSPASPRRFP